MFVLFLEASSLAIFYHVTSVFRKFAIKHNCVFRIGVVRGGHGSHAPPQPTLNKNKDLGRAGAKGGLGVWFPNRHAWPPNQKAYSFDNSGF